MVINKNLIKNNRQQLYLFIYLFIFFVNSSKDPLIYTWEKLIKKSSLKFFEHWTLCFSCNFFHTDQCSGWIIKTSVAAQPWVQARNHNQKWFKYIFQWCSYSLPCFETRWSCHFLKTGRQIPHYRHLANIEVIVLKQY